MISRAKTPSRKPKVAVPASAPSQQRKFTRAVWRYYAKHQRDFAWRNSRDPYGILVSEVMLQQTQTARVTPYYEKFLLAFPTIESLAAAPTRKLLKIWSGLGYNRRALALRQAAQAIVQQKKFPRSIDTLQELPGVGPYTAAAVACFAFNIPSVFIETNIRAVFLHHFFLSKKSVPDKKLLPLIAETLPHRRARDWYYALMDYGAFLKRAGPNPNRRSQHHVIQAPFRGSVRQARGAVIRALVSHRQLTLQQLLTITTTPVPLLKVALARLRKEQVIEVQQRSFRLAKK